jgi:hypothetical protein
MSWDRSRKPGTNPKYRSKQHRDYRATLVAQLKRDGYLVCTAAVCVFDTRTITNPNGRDPDGLNAGHADDGVNYRGPEHRMCNLKDGSRRARAKQVNGEETRPWYTVQCVTCGGDIRTKYPKTRYCPGGGCTPARPEREPPAPQQPCPVCGATITGRRRTYCGTGCRSEGGARQMRDRYRASVGLPIDPGRPTKRWPR